jgi:hypothetical protein
MTVSLDEHAPSPRPSELGDSTLAPEDLDVLASALDSEHTNHSVHRVYRGSFVHERPLECQIPVKEADESEKQFRGRMEIEENCLQAELSKRTFLGLELDDQGQVWTMDELLIFRNRLEDCWRCPRGCRADEGGGGAYVCTFKAEKHLAHDRRAARPLIHIRCPLKPLEDYSSPGKRKILPPLEWRDDPSPANGVEVSVPVAWVAAAQVRTPGEAEEDSVESGLEPVWSPVEDSVGLIHFDKRGRPRVRGREVRIGRFEGRFRPRDSSSWIEENELLLVHEKSQFTRPMRHFVRNFPREHIQEAGYTLGCLKDALHVTRTRERADHSAKAFLKIPGWLCLRLSRDGSARSGRSGPMKARSVGLCQVSGFIPKLFRY